MGKCRHAVSWSGERPGSAESPSMPMSMSHSRTSWRVQEQQCLQPSSCARQRVDAGHAASSSSELVTPAKRRRLMAAQRAQAREDSVVVSDVKQATWHQLVRNLPSFDDSSLRSVFPFAVHNSHECIICGGFVGCIRCASVIAAFSQSALSSQCRGHCTAGSSGPIKRLAAGLIPRGSTWPSGEDKPLPKRLRQ